MKISGIQIFWMIAAMELGMTLLMTMTSSLQAAKQDAWISMIIAGGIALFIAFVATQLAVLYPNQTLVQFTETILGKWIGKFVIVIYMVQWYTIIPIILRQFTDLIELLLLPSTPRAPIVILMVLLVVYVTYAGGIDGIGRCSEVLGPIIIVMVLLVLFFSLNNITFKQILPVYRDHGIMPIFNGALAPASYLGHAVEFVMLAAFMDNPSKGSRYVYWGVLIANVLVVLSTAMVVLTIGINLLPTMWYPFFEMTRQISIFAFIENLDAIAIVIWISSVFIKLAIYMFITCYGTAQFLKIKNWRMLIWFVAPFVTILAIIPRNVTQSTTHYLLNYWVPVVLPINMIGIPLLLLIISKIQKRRKRANLN